MGKTWLIGLLGVWLAGCVLASPWTPPVQGLENVRRMKDQQNAWIDPDKEYASYRAQDTITGWREYLFRHHEGDKYYAEASARLDQLLHPGGPEVQNNHAPSPLLQLAAAELTLYRAKEGAIAYAQASAASAVLYRFSPNEELKVVGREREWLIVRFSTRTSGYVKQSDAVPLAQTPTASPAPSSVHEPEGVIIQGTLVKWGASQAEAKSVVNPQRMTDFYCSGDEASFPGVKICFASPGVEFGDKVQYRTSLHFHQDRLFEYSARFSTDRFYFIAGTIEQRLGPPTKTEKSTVQNKMGASFEQIEKTWELSAVTVKVALLASKVTEGEMIVRYRPLASEVKAGSGKAPF